MGISITGGGGGGSGIIMSVGQLDPFTLGRGKRRGVGGERYTTRPPTPTLLPKMADAAVTVVSLKMRFEVEGRLK